MRACGENHSLRVPVLVGTVALFLILVTCWLFLSGQKDSGNRSFLWLTRVLDRCRGINHAKDYGITSTGSQLSRLATTIEIYAKENGRVPGIENADSNGAIASKIILQDLAHTSLDKRLISPQNDIVRTNATGAIVDSWGREIHFTVTRLGNSADVLIWSDGPNERNDRCTKDDIFVRTDLLELADDGKPPAP